MKKEMHRSKTQIRRNCIWGVILLINLLLGLLLWFGGFTNYSWTGTIADIAYPFVVMFFGLFSLIALFRISGWGKRLLALLSCIPSLFGGCASQILTIILFLPPFTLGTIFRINQASSETLIQQAVSPDGWRIAEVHFQPVGAYGAGNGQVQVRIRHRLLPFIERDVCYVRGSHADENTTDYLYWQDNDTVYIPEEQQEVNVNRIRFQLPTVVSIPVSLIDLYYSLLEEEEIDYNLTAPAREIPVPGQIANETHTYWEETDTAIWNFDVSGFNPDQLAEWYLETFSSAPWQIIQTRRQVTQENPGSDHIAHHIQARTIDDEGQKRDYCIEIFGSENASSVHVNVFTPDCSACEYWFGLP